MQPPAESEVPERIAAIQEVAEAVRASTNRVAQLTETLNQARADTSSELAALRRLSVAVVIGLTILFLSTIAGAYTLYLVQDTVSPGGHRNQESRANTTALVSGVVGQIDCLQRRSMAGLPAVDPRQPCSQQTPPDVYPGARP